MRLESMTIQNFRGYQEEQKITFSDLTTFVGKNDAGKSTVLEALSIFFGDGTVKPDLTDFNVFTNSDNFEIGCTFSDLPDEIVIDSNAKTNLGSEFLLDNNDMLTVKKDGQKVLQSLMKRFLLFASIRQLPVSIIYLNKKIVTSSLSSKNSLNQRKSKKKEST
ncbi:AAA family ATPase [Rothia sp. P4278]|uniref:AAA family ATPase n=1 Tax=Rothia sp. P4278 TaxID=3402658 RepID=UPI003AE1FFBF